MLDSIDALNCGNLISACTHAFTGKARGVIFWPLFASSAFCDFLNTFRSVISASSNWVTWGKFTQLRCRFRALGFLMLESEIISISPNLEKSTSGICGIPPPTAPAALCLPAPLLNFSLTKFWMSSLRICPFWPVGVTSLRLTPYSRACFQTA